MGSSQSNRGEGAVGPDHLADDDLLNDYDDSEQPQEDQPFVASIIGKSLAGKIGYGGKKAEYDEGLEECCPSLTLQQRLWGFGISLAIGMMMSYMSGFYLVRPSKFAVIYTVGNLFSLGSTMFLMGPHAQIKRMLHPDRATATCIYIGTMLLTVIVAKKTGRIALVMPLIFLQWVALIWYSLSYIPFGQRMLKSCVTFCCNGICDGS
mmetsp:Transcript_9223/g.12681  ORF Transcript_9223/g.12681 Transcript_9223/m.12681 type:complete len:207 (+) Transcript_9223:21-641(+)